jgi:hypothetical protein
LVKAAGNKGPPSQRQGSNGLKSCPHSRDSLVCMTSLQCVFHELPLRFRSRNCYPNLHRELPCGEKTLTVLDNIEIQLPSPPGRDCSNHAEHVCMKAGRVAMACFPAHAFHGGWYAELYLPFSAHSTLPMTAPPSAQQIPIAVAAYFALASVAVVGSAGLDQRTTIRTSPRHLTCRFLDLGYRS